MKPGSALLAMGTALALSGTIGCQRAQGLSEADQAAIREAGARYERLVNAGDFKGLTAFYTEDATLLPPGLPAVQGRAAIEAVNAGGPPISNVQIQLLELDGRSDLAYTRDAVSFTVHPPGAAPVDVRIKVMTIWRKGADGSWRILRDMLNADPDPSGPKPCQFRLKKHQVVPGENAPGGG